MFFFIWVSTKSKETYSMFHSCIQLSFLPERWNSAVDSASCLCRLFAEVFEMDRFSSSNSSCSSYLNVLQCVFSVSGSVGVFTGSMRVVVSHRFKSEKEYERRSKNIFANSKYLMNYFAYCIFFSQATATYLKVPSYIVVWSFGTFSL